MKNTEEVNQKLRAWQVSEEDVIAGFTAEEARDWYINNISDDVYPLEEVEEVSSDYSVDVSEETGVRGSQQTIGEILDLLQMQLETGESMELNWPYIAYTG